MVNRWWRTGFLVLAVTIILVIAFAGYVIIDQGVTITYMEVGYKDTLSDLDVLRHLTPELHRGAKQKDVLVILRQQNPNALITETGNTVGIGQIEFVFDEAGQLVEIKSL